MAGCHLRKQEENTRYASFSLYTHERYLQITCFFVAMVRLFSFSFAVHTKTTDLSVFNKERF